ncbi:uncharacterized protein LOC143301148 isoform X2 [Babylonia areolata]|uniref:uncharacterized protein LOC143301148 isoform X2 n=1 Tax=Babylonia areolata TaxID=304850 RepID=UPI003FD660E4
MWTYHVICLCALVVLSSERPARVCRTDDFLQIQRTCRVRNDDLLVAVKEHDDGMVCKKLMDLFFCVAGHVPLCFQNVTAMYKSYFHSPHNCVLSAQQIMSLQNLTTRTAHDQGDRPEDVHVEVDIIMPLSTPPMETSSEEEKGMTEEEEEKGEEGRSGRHEEQSGSFGSNGGPGTRPHTLIPVVVAVWVGVWRMTSYLPLLS